MSEKQNQATKQHSYCKEGIYYYNNWYTYIDLLYHYYKCITITRYNCAMEVEWRYWILYINWLWLYAGLIGSNNLAVCVNPSSSSYQVGVGECFFWYRLTRIVLDRWPWNGCVCASVLRTHTHTHTRLTALFPGLPGWACTRKVKPIWILLKQETVSGSGISWAICKSASRSWQITTPAPHHSVLTECNIIIQHMNVEHNLQWMTGWTWHQRVHKVTLFVVAVARISRNK